MILFIHLGEVEVPLVFTKSTIVFFFPVYLIYMIEQVPGTELMGIDDAVEHCVNNEHNGLVICDSKSAHLPSSTLLALSVRR